MTEHRPPWDDFFLNLAREAATRSTCSRLNVGAVVTHYTRVLSIGYNGAPRGLPHCEHATGDNTPCEISEHAERNALTYSRETVTGCTLYVTHAPCYACSRGIINAGIARVVYRDIYRDTSGIDLLTRANVKVERRCSHEGGTVVLKEQGRDAPLTIRCEDCGKSTELE